jgi:hypothetical protein
MLRLNKLPDTPVSVYIAYELCRGRLDLTNSVEEVLIEGQEVITCYLNRINGDWIIKYDYSSQAISFGVPRRR